MGPQRGGSEEDRSRGSIAGGSAWPCLAAGLILALAVSSCAGGRDYTRPPGVSPEQARRDVRECEAQRLVPRPPAASPTARYGSPTPSDPKIGYGDALKQDLAFRKCMEARGYTDVK